MNKVLIDELEKQINTNIKIVELCLWERDSVLKKPIS